ncbi:hypothetical protein [Nocardioides dongkuii]|uniref:hypothetical protein n=1 Tax=Nocardioides dongkuii TaxID=2760089 RepID=UPI0015F8CA5F|nr:hypothetical protein [Nocardioides dongkuii]
MTARGLVAALALALVGLAAGYGVGALRGGEPGTIPVAAPLPAASPAYPRDPEVTVRPDPDFPTLERNLPVRPVRLGEPPFDLRLLVPRGWIRSDATMGASQWYPPPGPDLTENTYFLRVRFVASLFTGVEEARDARIEALGSASGISELDVESRSADTFVATYVSEGYRRVTMERFVTDGRSGNAFASIAVIGREEDRDGLTSLLEAVTSTR